MTKNVLVDEFIEGILKKRDKKRDEFLKRRVYDLTRYLFCGFANHIVIISSNLYILKKSTFPKEENELAKTYIRKSFAWIKRKYKQIPFSDLSKSLDYHLYKPLFEVKKLLPFLEKNLKVAVNEDEKAAAIKISESILDMIIMEGRKYAGTIERYYREFTGIYLADEDIIIRALMEFRTKEQILEQARWLKEQGIEPNSFEKAAMEYYGV